MEHRRHNAGAFSTIHINMRDKKGFVVFWSENQANQATPYKVTIGAKLDFEQ